jgi:hypothetical protein
MKHIETIIEANRVHIKFEVPFENDVCIKTYTLTKTVPEYEGVALSDYLTQAQIEAL